MDDSNFLVVVEATLQNTQEMIEESFGDRFEVDYQDGVLTITLESEEEYVINRHLPQHQIWLSSPVSGTHYFSYEEDSGRWKAPKEEGLYLRPFLMEELKTISEKSFVA
ncbi:MAG: iron donor protein CyaY [bacterium]|nr:iron donor protein CyaY [bacterium]